jgi:UDP-glucose 4-epimerase
MKILVTGGAGFIASHVADNYLAAGHRVVVLDNLSGGKHANVPKRARFVKMDLRDRRGIEKLFAREKFQAVNNHAAQMSVPASVADPRFDADVNVQGLLNLLEGCKAHRVKKFIHVSSGGTVYGVVTRFPATEKYPILPMTPYGITKAVGEDYLRFYQDSFGLDYTILRYSNVYGPRQQPHGEAGVVSIFIKQLLVGKTPTIFGDGSIIRDYVYVGDVAAANLLALSKGSRQAYNIGTRVPTNLKKLFSVIAAEVGFKGKANHGPARVGDLQENWLAWDKARKELGWKPRVDLKQGIHLTAEFFQNER